MVAVKPMSASKTKCGDGNRYKVVAFGDMCRLRVVPKERKCT